MGVSKMQNGKRNRKRNETENLMQYYLHDVWAKFALLCVIFTVTTCINKKIIINMRSVIKKTYGFLKK